MFEKKWLNSRGAKAGFTETCELDPGIHWPEITAAGFTIDAYVLFEVTSDVMLPAAELAASFAESHNNCSPLFGEFAARDGWRCIKAEADDTLEPFEFVFCWKLALFLQLMTISPWFLISCKSSKFGGRKVNDSSFGWRFLYICAYFSIWFSVFANRNAMSIFDVFSEIDSNDFAKHSEVSARPAEKENQKLISHFIKLST